jgi:hypothetical protein
MNPDTFHMQNTGPRRDLNRFNEYEYEMSGTIDQSITVVNECVRRRVHYPRFEHLPVDLMSVDEIFAQTNLVIGVCNKKKQRQYEQRSIDEEESQRVLADFRNIQFGNPNDDYRQRTRHHEHEHQNGLSFNRLDRLDSEYTHSRTYHPNGQNAMTGTQFDEYMTQNNRRQSKMNHSCFTADRLRYSDANTNDSKGVSHSDTVDSDQDDMYSICEEHCPSSMIKNCANGDTEHGFQNTKKLASSRQQHQFPHYSDHQFETDDTDHKYATIQSYEPRPPPGEIIPVALPELDDTSGHSSSNTDSNTMDDFHYFTSSMESSGNMKSISNEDIPFLKPNKITRIEIAPGQYLPLRGASETVCAIQCGFCVTISCMACVQPLLCIANCEMVLCPDCRIVSPNIHTTLDTIHRRNTSRFNNNTIPMDRERIRPIDEYDDGLIRLDVKSGVGLGLQA